MFRLGQKCVGCIKKDVDNISAIVSNLINPSLCIIILMTIIVTVRLETWPALNKVMAENFC